MRSDRCAAGRWDERRGRPRARRPAVTWARLLPLAVAAGAGIQTASLIWTGLLLGAGGVCVAISCRAASRRRPGTLCSWQEVDQGLERELRRARRRRFLFGSLAPHVGGGQPNGAVSVADPRRE